MQSFRVLFTGVLSAAVNLSLCSGLAVSAAMLSLVVQAEEAGAMTPAGFEFACVSFSHEPEAAERAEKPTQSCEDGSSCLRASIRSEMHRSLGFPVSPDAALLPAAPAFSADPLSAAIVPPAARDGPLYAYAPSAAHELQKRE